MSDCVPSRSPSHPLILNGATLSVADVHSVAARSREVELTGDPAVLDRMEAGVSVVRSAVEEGRLIYGVTTGFGGMGDVAVPPDLAADSQNNLLSFLAAGAGPPIDPVHVRAAMLLRANMLLRGVSGVRTTLVERIIRFLREDAIPIVRELGSIGASGDLVPLATIARAVTGQAGGSQVVWRDRPVESVVVLKELGLQPLELLPKEGLAIINGTSFSSAVAANSVRASRNLLGTQLGSLSMMVRALCGQTEPFEPFVHESKPHAGQVWAAEILRRWLHEGVADSPSPQSSPVQDRYSIRCLPQYLGPIVEGVARVTHVVETEMNAVTDNPLVDTTADRFYQSGNFLGQYIGIAMDDLRRFLGLLAKLVDVQIAQLVSPEFSQGLPASLKGNEARIYNMGLKGLQITGNSIMPLLTYYGNPLVEHFPTHAEQYNQNINGLGWGAANLAWRSVQLSQQYTAVSLVFAAQALDLRAQIEQGHYDGRALLGTFAEPLYAAIYSALGVRPGGDKPLIFDDVDQSLEKQLAILAADIAGEGAVVSSISPLLKVFDNASLAC